MFSISEIAANVGKVESDLVVGISDDEIDQLRISWNFQQLPRTYIDFLRLMGRAAGKILQGTDAFFPVILDMQRASGRFFEDNLGGMQLPPGAFVFAMHQGYQVYWMESTNLSDPAVVLYMEQEPSPMARWQSLTEFFNAEYSAAYTS
ncbi:SMI1/KNR4 family protein [Micromonospora sp. NPDC049102]|uniref:SMI1/KNR4 family protein n=1 Tax=Micromonospora sp. NPDC049102 TaxID=3364265 RepID=UPI00371A3EE4